MAKQYKILLELRDHKLEKEKESILKILNFAFKFFGIKMTYCEIHDTKFIRISKIKLKP